MGIADGGGGGGGGASGQARYDKWGVGVLSASDPIRKVGALCLGLLYLNTFLPVTILAEGREALGAPSQDTPLHMQLALAILAVSVVKNMVCT